MQGEFQVFRKTSWWRTYMYWSCSLCILLLIFFTRKLNFGSVNLSVFLLLFVSLFWAQASPIIFTHLNLRLLCSCTRYCLSKNLIWYFYVPFKSATSECHWWPSRVTRRSHQSLHVDTFPSRDIGARRATPQRAAHSGLKIRFHLHSNNFGNLDFLWGNRFRQFSSINLMFNLLENSVCQKLWKNLKFNYAEGY